MAPELSRTPCQGDWGMWLLHHLSFLSGNHKSKLGSERLAPDAAAGCARY